MVKDYQMIRFVRTDCYDQDFLNLVRALDSELAIIDGEEHSFYSQFNKIENIKCVVIAYQEDEPIGCGAIKDYGGEAMEIKRMFVSPESRNKGVASKILSDLESWTRELNYSKCILETGIRQPDAIALYRKNGYIQIPNWGQYIGVENSVCFEKMIREERITGKE
jgi:putative acetyltransferase